MNLLAFGMLPWRLIGLGALLAGLVASVAWYGHSREAKGYARAQAEYSERENKALREALAERERIGKELDDVAREARLLGDALEKAQLGLVDAGQRLRVELSRRRGAKCPAAVAAGSTPAEPPVDLHTDVQRRLDEAAEGIARFADQSHIAGIACERSADAMN